jgi:periplasmic copper chaperone A
MPRPRTPARRAVRRTAVRLVAGLAVAAGAVLVGATAASAHVHVDGEDATRGGYGVLTFRVPTESDTASTTEVTVTMPTRTPIASASVEPVAGWTATVSTAKLSTPVETDDGQLTSFVSRIVWKADAGKGIRPGQFQRFAVSAGPLPDVARLEFPTRQTYSDGSVVDWNQSATGSAEPEHPAPVLELAAASGSADEPSPAATDAASAAQPDGSGTAALAVGIVAVVVAVAALLVALVGLLRSRRGASGA